MTRIAPLETLRGVAALGVALFHLQTYTFLVQNQFIQNAPLLVDFFFVLSGFVISLSFTSRIKTGSSIGKFQWRRVRRLFPLHLFTFALWIGIVLAMPWLPGGYDNYNEPSEAGSFFSLFGREMFEQMFLLHGLTGGGQGLLFNYPSWTISVEFWTYLIFAVAVLFFRHLIWIGAVGAALFCMLALVQAGGPDAANRTAEGLAVMDQTNGPLALMRCIYGFSMGILAYRLVLWLKFRTGSAPLLALLALAIAGIVILGGTTWEVALTGIFAGIVALTSRLRPDTVLYQVLNVKPMVFLGTISYSLYMVHAALWWLLPQVFVAVAPDRFEFATMQDGSYLPYSQLSLTSMESLIYTIFCVVLLIAISSVTYYLVERPFMSNPLRRKIRARRAARGRPARRRVARPAAGGAPAAARAAAPAKSGKRRQAPDPADAPPVAPITRNPAVLARQRMEAARRKVTMAEASGAMAGSGVRAEGTGVKGVPNWQADGYPDWQRGTPKRR